MPDTGAADTNYVCDRCGYPVCFVAGRWVHDNQGDAAMCQILDWADRGRKLQQTINDLGCGPDA